MIRQLIRAKRRYILVDLDTQKDFFLADGNACVRNHRRVLANVRRIMAWARRKNIPIISISDIHPDNNGHNENNYCIQGSEGQKKIRYTLINDRIDLPADGNCSLPRNILYQYRQIILQKRSKDPFDEPLIERLLSEVQAGEFVIIGATAEDTVQAAVLGLLQRGKRVSVVVDAVGLHNRKEADMAMRKIKAKGAKLIETKKYAGLSHLRRVGVCNCKACRGRSKKTTVEINAE